MTKHRLRILFGLMIGLSVLLWLDNASKENNGGNQSLALANSNAEASAEVQALATENTMQDDGSPNLFAASHENPLSFLRAENLRETVDRPLFAPNRRPPKKRKNVVRAPAPAAKPQKKRNTYRLLGIIRSQERSIALLAGEKNGLNFRVETGDLIGGWFVKHVKAKQITLEQDQLQVVLSIP